MCGFLSCVLCCGLMVWLSGVGFGCCWVCRWILFSLMFGVF